MTLYDTNSLFPYKLRKRCADGSQDDNSNFRIPARLAETAAPCGVLPQPPDARRQAPGASRRPKAFDSNFRPCPLGPVARLLRTASRRVAAAAIFALRFCRVGAFLRRVATAAVWGGWQPLRHYPTSSWEELHNEMVRRREVDTITVATFSTPFCLFELGAQSGGPVLSSYIVHRTGRVCGRTVS